MRIFGKKVVASPQPNEVWLKDDMLRQELSDGSQGSTSNREFFQLVTTFVTTLCCFGIFLIQGIIIARILGTVGRGEFGTAIYFPRDILLYAGLLGGIEIVNSYAKRPNFNETSLKYSALRLGLISGTITALFAAVLVLIAFTLLEEKSYLIPLCLLCCVFVPLEHVHLTVCAVDRGKEAYSRYNWNRLLFAAAFPVIVLVVFGFDELFKSYEGTLYCGFDSLLGTSPLLTICCIFIVSRVVGLLPTLRGMGIPAALLGRKRAGIVESADLEIPNWRKLLFEGRSYAMSMFASELFERLDVFLILALAAADQANLIGCYMVAVPAAALLTIGPNALGVFTFNAGADAKRRITMQNALSVMAVTALFQIVATIVFLVIIPYLIVMLFTDEFAEAVPFALWLLPACAIKGYLQAVDGFLKGRGKPMIGVWSRVISIFVMLVFVWATFSRFELLSIPMAACVGQFVSMVIISVAVIKDVSEREMAVSS